MCNTKHKIRFTEDGFISRNTQGFWVSESNKRKVKNEEYNRENDISKESYSR